MTKQFDVVSTGECLIDVLMQEDRQNHRMTMVGNAGGAPVNVLVALSHLNHSTAYLGKLSKDAGGAYLLEIIREHGINTRGIVFTDDKTTLAMVSLNAEGDRDFSFYRQNTADVNYCPEEVNLDVIRQGRVFHFGSVSMTTEPSRSATLYGARYAREQGVKVSFDPNLRPVLWDDLDQARHWIREGFQVADYVKVSEEELELLTGKTDILEGARELLEAYHFQFLSVTLGAKGCICFANGTYGYEKTYATNCIDTTGSGDAAWGATLSCLVRLGNRVAHLSREDLREIARFANAAGALCASKHGAIYAMPTLEEIQQCMEKIPRLEWEEELCDISG